MDICPSIECETDWCFIITEFPNCINDFKVFGFIKMKYGIEVIIMACESMLSTTLINSLNFRFQKSQSVGLDYRAWANRLSA
jgi:hypothetical protein